MFDVDTSGRRAGYGSVSLSVNSTPGRLLRLVLDITVEQPACLVACSMYEELDEEEQLETKLCLITAKSKNPCILHKGSL